MEEHKTGWDYSRDEEIANTLLERKPLSAVDIAKEMGLSRTVVANHFVRIGDKLRMPVGSLGYRKGYGILGGAVQSPKGPYPDRKKPGKEEPITDRPAHDNSKILSKRGLTRYMVECTMSSGGTSLLRTNAKSPEAAAESILSQYPGCVPTGKVLSPDQHAEYLQEQRLSGVGPMSSSVLAGSYTNGRRKTSGRKYQ